MWQFLNLNPYGYNLPYDSLSPFIGPSGNSYPFLAQAFSSPSQGGDSIQTGQNQSSSRIEFHLHKPRERTAVIIASVIGGLIVLTAAALLVHRYRKPRQVIDLRFGR
jgi:hypothetical protein